MGIDAARRLAPHAALVVGFAVALALGCSGPGGGGRPRAAAAVSATPSVVQSNVVRGDYAGSAACAPCHADVVSAWTRSAMHLMTRDARAAVAPFDGADGTVWRFKGDTVRLEGRGDDRFIHVEAAGAPAKTYRVTRTIGGRTREDFAGVDVQAGGEEVILPVSFVLATRTLRYKGYSVMVHERATVRAGPIWSRTCIFCHNTVPEMDRLLGALAGSRAPAYQGEQVDEWLPSARRARAKVTDAGEFSRAARDEIARLGGAAPRDEGDSRSIARRAIDVVRAGFDGAALVEEGIGCEACHGGAREHTLDPGVRPSFSPVAPWLDIRLPDASPKASRPQAINRVCARCHQVLFSRYPFTWEGGRRDSSAGGSHISSGEARDFLLGGCAGQMACTNCHDPHARTDPDALRALATPAGNIKCTGCHSDLADQPRLRAHAHHDPEGAGGACIACHMPRKNMGLEGLTRYHRIGSPTDPARVLGDRPLECALCHADRAVGALVDSMESWWPVRYPRQRLLELYGSLDASVMKATLERGKPHEQAVAIATFGERRDRAATPLVAAQLLGEYPLVREWAKRALTSILGRCEVNLAADDETIAREAVSCGSGGPGIERPHGPTRAPAPGDEEPED